MDRQRWEEEIKNISSKKEMVSHCGKNLLERRETQGRRIMLPNSGHSAQKNQIFVDVLKFTKPSQEDEDDAEGEFIIKIETSTINCKDKFLLQTVLHISSNHINMTNNMVDGIQK